MNIMSSEGEGAYRAHKERIENSLPKSKVVNIDIAPKESDKYSAMALEARKDLALIKSKLGRLWYRIKYGKAAQLFIIVGTYPIFSGLMISMVANTSLDISEGTQIATIAIVSAAAVLGTIAGFFGAFRVLKDVPKELW